METKTSLRGSSITTNMDGQGGLAIETIRFFRRSWLTSRLSRICLIAISLLFAGTLGASDEGDATGRRAVLYVAKGTFGVQGVLYTLDPATGAVLTTVGLLNDAAGHNYGMGALKHHPTTGIFYGATAHNSPTNPDYLVTVNPATALVTPIGPFGAVLTDIAIDPTTGIMYAVSGYNQKFYTINTATGLATQIGSTGLGYQNGGGLAADRTGVLFPDLVRAADFNPSNVLYGLEGGGGIDNLHLRLLVTFNLTTGLGTLVGVIPVYDLDAMAFIPVAR